MTGRVLVADGDVDRARAVAEALAAHGLTCRTASHGAQALESALAEVPDAVLLVEASRPSILEAIRSEIAAAAQDSAFLRPPGLYRLEFQIVKARAGGA